MRTWRNWQTRTAKDRVGNTLQVQVLLSAPLIKPLKRGAFDLSCWFRAGLEPGFTAGSHFFNFSRNEMSCFTASLKKTRISRKLVGRDLRLIFIFCDQAVELALNCTPESGHAEAQKMYDFSWSHPVFGHAFDMIFRFSDMLLI